MHITPLQWLFLEYEQKLLQTAPPVAPAAATAATAPPSATQTLPHVEPPAEPIIIDCSRLQRLLVFDPDRLKRVPWPAVERAIRRHRRGDEGMARSLAPKMRRLAERCINPLREGDVEVLEDLWRSREQS